MSFPTSPIDGEVYNKYTYSSTNQSWIKMDPTKSFNIGFTYTQLPGKQSPSEMGWYGTWLNKSSELAGDFLRIEGGEASTFESGEQNFAMQGHWHSLSNNLGDKLMNYFDDAAESNSAGGTAGIPKYDTSMAQIEDTPVASTIIADTANGTPSIDSETRPVNKTIRIWERTA